MVLSPDNGTSRNGFEDTGFALSNETKTEFFFWDALKPHETEPCGR